jgi:endonuclease/exonuclease/phosphatase family metal-dependent hydrolase
MGVRPAVECARRAALGLLVRFVQWHRLVARYGIHGALETKLVSAPSDEPAYVIGADVCADAACSATLRVYVTHLVFNDVDEHVVDTALLAQTQTMLDWIATRPHADKHIIVGDFNAFEREPAVDFRCELTFNLQTPKAMRDAGYLDAWLAEHGTTPGMTATLNHNGCGVTNGGPWKRIDYAYLKGLTPSSSSFFAFEPANTAAPSDHYGLLTGFTGRADTTS